MTEALRAFTALLDDAAVFPPGNLPLADAVTAHYGHRHSAYAELVGPLVLPAAALGGLAPLLEPGTAPLAVSVTLPGEPAAVSPAVAAAAALDTVTLAAVETPLAAGAGIGELLAALDAALPDSVTGYVEVPRDERGVTVLDALASSRYRAKFRTGGLVPQAHPSEAELARTLTGAVARGLAFKCTAGLHHAIRHTDGDLEQHGFLNVLLATEAALRGAAPEELAALLARRDAAVAGQVAGLGPGRLAAARASFTSFGTCSVTGPRDDLIRLGLLPTRAAA
ncbi:MAG TPA: hypothetical protein VKS82_10155 [Streptosporangiaceae bacterium]|nr:hypothetical protein [Streptosporangiaceae bacterium]